MTTDELRRLRLEIAHKTDLQDLARATFIAFAAKDAPEHLFEAAPAGWPVEVRKVVEDGEGFVASYPLGTDLGGRKQLCWGVYATNPENFEQTHLGDLPPAPSR